MRTIFSCVLCFITLDPIYTREFDLRGRHGKSTFTTPSACFVTRVIVFLSVALACITQRDQGKPLRGLWSFEMSLSLWRFVKSGSRIWTHSIETQRERRQGKEKTEKREDWQWRLCVPILCVRLWQFGRVLFVKQVCNYQSTRDACVSSVVPATLSHKGLHVGCVHVATTRNEWR